MVVDAVENNFQQGVPSGWETVVIDAVGDVVVFF